MSFEQLIPIIVVVPGAVTVIISLWKMMPYQRITEIDQLRTAKEVLDKNSNSFDEKLHPYTKEIASRIITRSDFVSAYELGYLLKLEDSHQCIKDFIRAKKCFEPISEKGNQVLEFTGPYRSKCLRSCLKWFAAGTYFVTAFTCFLPLLF